MRVPAFLCASWRRGWRPLAVLLLCGAAALAQAQSADDGSGAAPPDRTARLSYIAGDLGFLPAGSQDWASADLNRPLTTGDRLSAGDGARAELELGGANLRLDGGTDVGLLNLDDNIAQVELTQGTLNLSVRQLGQGQSYEIDTPTLALVVNQPGTYRIDVDNGGNGTRVTVFDGQATVYGQDNAQHDVFAGRSYQFDDPSLAALSISDYGGGDAFDAWCSQRDRRYAQSDAARYVSSDVVGYQDLDQYGSWQDSPDYGAVWYPSQVPADWAPYRDGHWAWIAPWGWTWVDDTPWGFAPYHYGRWAFIGRHWGWIPGPRVARPVYAPALVAFVGGGVSVSVGIGSAPVGWFPLGPGEVYNPWYHCNRDYYHRVNVTNIYVRNTMYRNTVINNINNQYNFYREGRTPRDLHYLNRGAPHGFTAMSGANFASGRRVQREMMHADPRQLAAAPVLARGVAALRPAPRDAAASRNPRLRMLPTADFRRDVVARTPPPKTLPSAHPDFAPAAARVPQHMPFANVRVLNTRGAPHPAAGAQAQPIRSAPTLPRPMHPAGATPVAGLPNVPRMEPAPARADALPSARFAHPQAGERSLPAVEPIRRAPPAELRQAPRPGVSYIAGPQQPRPQANERPANTLPQPPRFERAPARPAPLEHTPAPQYVQPRQEQPREYARPNYQPQPRYEQPQPRYEPPQPRQEQPQPRYQPPQPRFEQPWPRSEPARAAAQPHAEPVRRPPPRRDDQQH